MIEKEPYSLDALSSFIEFHSVKGDHGTFLYINRDIWNKYREKCSLNEILSFMRQNGIRRIYIPTTYGTKKIGIWL